MDIITTHEAATAARQMIDW